MRTTLNANPPNVIFILADERGSDLEAWFADVEASRRRHPDAAFK